MLRRVLGPTSCFLVLLLLAAAAAAQNGTSPIVTSDLLNIRTASQLAISPDGSRVVYVVTSMGRDGDGDYRYFRHLWLASLDGQTPPRPLTHGERDVSHPRWSPDGLRLAFVRRHEDKNQIWVLPLNGGEAYALTSLESGASSPTWSPDGTKLAFLSRQNEYEFIKQPEWDFERPGRERFDTPNWKNIEKNKGHSSRANKDENRHGQGEGSDASIDSELSFVKTAPDGRIETIRSWLAKNASKGNPRVFHRLDLQGEHDVEEDLAFDQIYLVDVEPGSEPRQLTETAVDHDDIVWTPDGKSILFTAQRSSQHPDRDPHTDIYRLDIASRSSQKLVEWSGWSLSSPLVSPDGRNIAFLARDDADHVYSLNRMAIANANGSQPRLAAPDYPNNLRSLRWSADSKHVYFVSTQHGRFPLRRLTLADASLRDIVSGDSGVRSYALGGDKLAYALTEVANPNEVYAAASDGSSAKRLTSLNAEWLQAKRIVQPREHWLERPEKPHIQYWIMEPAGREDNKRYPLALEIHGGPSAMWGPGEFTMWHEFQLLCSWGYGVVYSNPRGSGGYGYDFKRANYRDWGQGPSEDVLACLDQAAQLEWVDREQLFVTGGSYAGYLTAWIVSQDQRFKAAVAQRGVYDLSFFFGEGNAWRLIPHHFGGYPWEQEARTYLDANSPQTFVENIHTPMLIMHADNDLRTGVRQSEMLYKSLKVLGRPVEYVRYPDEGHNLSRTGNPKRRMDRLNRIIEFFERYVERTEAPLATRSE